MTRRATQTALGALLAERIRTRGPIPFAEFMKECLYHPDHGYYSRAETRRFADYYTSPDVHAIFGRLLARQFSEMWQRLGRPERFALVEAGAGTGRLGAQILDFVEREMREFYRAVEYAAVEQSPARRAAHGESLGRHLAAGHAASVAGLPNEIPMGCVFSNELVDAFPVHRVVQEQGELREVYVDFSGERFEERLGPLSTPAAAEYFGAQGIHLGEGQQAEACLAACEWIEDTGRRLGRGFVLTIDYGHPAPELFNERHMRGTALAYRRHRASEDFYAEPGEQDLTAHVNFTALEVWGRRAGLVPLGLVSQAQFLLAVGRGNDFADLYDPGQSEAEKLRARLLLKNLIHPEGFGEAFQVFIQGKGVEDRRLAGLEAL